MREMGYGKGYKYAHDFPRHRVDQEHLPKRLKGKRYYRPGDQGFEKEIRKRMGQSRGSTKRDRPGTPDTP
jgi:putative ATPase